MSILGASSLQIDLQALASNWRFLHSRVSVHADCGAVVKANAYGLGVGRVAPSLYEAGCREFFVATIDEGVALRRLLRDVKIYVFQGVIAGREPDIVAAALTPIIISKEMLECWCGYSAAHCPLFPVAVKVNTGMNRFGLDVDEFMAFMGASSEFVKVNVVLLLSHLACADEPSHRLNRVQLNRFQSVVSAAKNINPQLRASLANSSGIFLGDDWLFDLVRPGASLYGINPCPGQANPMAVVVTLRSPVLQVREISKGESVGYGGTYECARDSVIVTVAAGYADGLLRSASNHGFARFNGFELPLRGVVSMDAIAFDATAIPAAQRPSVGDELELLGVDSLVDDVAARAGTIGYEVFTRLGERLHRVYK